MKKFQHGGDIYTRKIRYDFSANISPLGMPKEAEQALIKNVGLFEHYPDPDCTALRRAIAAEYGCNAEDIVCGNGASELIYASVLAFAPKKALLIAPCFSEYERALESVGCEIEYFYLSEDSGFELNEDILNYLTSDIDMFIFGSPNNPTGRLVSDRIMKLIAEKCSENGIAVMADQCFIEFAQNWKEYSAYKYPNVMLLNAFTKIYAMAGLRLGYMICRNNAANSLIRSKIPCWSVSLPAQVCGEAALSAAGYKEKVRSLTECGREFVMKNFDDLGIKYYPSDVNFILFRSELPLDKLLLNDGIAIRSCDNYVGLEKGYFRIAVRSREENEYLIGCIGKYYK